MSRIVRFIAVVAAAIAALLALAPAALAAEGLWGPIDDKVITFFAFGVMIFFVAFVVILSLIQIRLESRKQRAREDLERLRRP
ncbi:MAG TPA: hypothetical protein VK919_06205 [Solirubrobacterales bacterium]|nr:hypothetical protein [Solirubrobacterales bacterium]